MTSRATALRAHRGRRSRSSAYSMRTESHCDCTGLPAPSAKRARPSESVQGPRRLGGVCTRAKEIGRSLAIGPHDAVLRRHRAWMATSAKQAYKLRKQLVEPVFGIIKEQQGARRFLLRGLVNVAAEWTVLATVRYAPAHHRVR